MLLVTWTFVFLVFFLLLFLEKVVELVGGGSIINGAYLSSLCQKHTQKAANLAVKLILAATMGYIDSFEVAGGRWRNTS